MESVLQLLISSLSGKAVGQVGKQVGIDKTQAQQAIGMALPILIGALSRNTSSSAGAEALAGALQSDHDGSILKNLPRAVAKPETIEDGSAILGHVLGDRRSQVVKNVGRATNLDSKKVGQVFAMLAPVVLGALGQMKRKNQLDNQGLSALLQQEQHSMEGSASGLTQLLDMDDDGEVSEELVSMGAKLLGGLLSGKR